MEGPFLIGYNSVAFLRSIKNPLFPIFFKGEPEEHEDNQSRNTQDEKQIKMFVYFYANLLHFRTKHAKAICLDPVDHDSGFTSLLRRHQLLHSQLKKVRVF